MHIAGAVRVPTMPGPGRGVRRSGNHEAADIGFRGFKTRIGGNMAARPLVFFACLWLGLI